MHVALACNVDLAAADRAATVFQRGRVYPQVLGRDNDRAGNDCLPGRAGQVHHRHQHRRAADIFFDHPHQVLLQACDLVRAQSLAEGQAERSGLGHGLLHQRLDLRALVRLALQQLPAGLGHNLLAYDARFVAGVAETLLQHVRVQPKLFGQFVRPGKAVNWAVDEQRIGFDQIACSRVLGQYEKAVRVGGQVEVQSLERLRRHGRGDRPDHHAGNLVDCHDVCARLQHHRFTAKQTGADGIDGGLEGRAAVDQRAAPDIEGRRKDAGIERPDRGAAGFEPVGIVLGVAAVAAGLAEVVAIGLCILGRAGRIGIAVASLFFQTKFEVNLFPAHGNLVLVQVQVLVHECLGLRVAAVDFHHRRRQQRSRVAAVAAIVDVQGGAGNDLALARRQRCVQPLGHRLRDLVHLRLDIAKHACRISGCALLAGVIHDGRRIGGGEAIDAGDCASSQVAEGIRGPDGDIVLRLYRAAVDEGGRTHVDVIGVHAGLVAIDDLLPRRQGSQGFPRIERTFIADAAAAGVKLQVSRGRHARAAAVDYVAGQHVERVGPVHDALIDQAAAHADAAGTGDDGRVLAQIVERAGIEQGLLLRADAAAVDHVAGV